MDVKIINITSFQQALNDVQYKPKIYERTP